MNGTAILLLPNTASQKDEKPHSVGLNNTATFQSLKYRMKKGPNMERQDCLMSICFITCSAVPIICSAFFIRCGTPLIICAIYYVIYCAFVVICSTFVVICCGFAIICGAYVIIRSDFSIIPTFCHSISSVLSLYRVV